VSVFFCVWVASVASVAAQGAEIATWADLWDAVNYHAVNASGTYTLAPAFNMLGYGSHGHINLGAADVTVLGQGAMLDSWSDHGSYGPFHFFTMGVADSGSVVDNCSLTLQNLTLKNGQTLQGGAVEVYGGTFTAIDVAFSANHGTDRFGGAVKVQKNGEGSTATFNAVRCLFSQNLAEQAGGDYPEGGGAAVMNNGATFTATDCQFVANEVRNRHTENTTREMGGAVITISYQDQPPGNTTFRGGWNFSGNTAPRGLAVDVFVARATAADAYSNVVFVTCAGARKPMTDCCTVPAPTPPCPPAPTTTVN
jgi:hypothetical protein